MLPYEGTPLPQKLADSWVERGKAALGGSRTAPTVGFGSLHGGGIVEYHYSRRRL
jgi:hypothetical protein